MDSMNLVPYIEDERLFDYAASCARTLRPDGSADGREAARALRRCFQETERCHSLLRRRYEGAARVPAACEWLLDNFYMLQREYPVLRTALREAERQRSTRGQLLILELSRALLQAGHGKLSEARCAAFLKGFQSVTVLQRRELTLFPTAIKAAILETAALCCKRLSASTEPEELTGELSALFGSLSLLSSMDMEGVLDEADVPGALLRGDPDGSFQRMERVTKNEYLRRLSELAEAEGIEEQDMARRLLEKAKAEGRHVGFLLFSPPGELPAAAYIAALTGLTLFGCLAAFAVLHDLTGALLLALPLWSLFKGLTDFLLLRLVRPRPLPRLALPDGVPPEGRTLCVLSVLLNCVEPERLEELRLASVHEGRELRFGLLADLPAAKTQTAPGDELMILNAKRRVEELNRKYGGGFYLFLRPRSFDGEGYSGAERKRGALMELAKLLCGQDSSLEVTGDQGRPLRHALHHLSGRGHAHFPRLAGPAHRRGHAPAEHPPPRPRRAPAGGPRRHPPPH